jgi:acetyltransferase-like isoleucine patch superfamily enzyme
MFDKLKLFISIESTSISRYFIEQIIFFLFGWVPSIIGIAFRSIAYKLIFKKSTGFVIRSGVNIKQAKNIVLHDNIYIDNYCLLQACKDGIEIGDNTRIMYGTILNVNNYRETHGSRIKIGKNCVIGAYSIIIGTAGTYIADNVIIAPRVSIFTNNHIYNDPAIPIKEQGITAKSVYIHDGVWIGTGVSILSGVTINKGSVVAAGALVIDDVPPYSLVAGVPAKVIKSWHS